MTRMVAQEVNTGYCTARHVQEVMIQKKVKTQTRTQKKKKVFQWAAQPTTSTPDHLTWLIFHLVASELSSNKCPTLANETCSSMGCRKAENPLRKVMSGHWMSGSPRTSIGSA